MATQKSQPAMALVANDPQLAAALSKATSDTMRAKVRDQRGNRLPNLELLTTQQNVTNTRARRNNDAQKILAMLPDVELGIQILVSSILSPADMISSDLSVVPAKNIFSAELTATLTNRLKDYLDKETTIQKDLHVMLRDMLAEKGAYPIAVIPENAIDALINKQTLSMESMRSVVSDKLFNRDGSVKSLGILGNPVNTESTEGKKPSVCFESYFTNTKNDYNHNLVLEDELIDKHVNVTDNINILKLKSLGEVIKKKTIEKKINQSQGAFSLESYSDREIESLIYKTRDHSQRVVQAINGQDEIKRSFIGKPLIFKLPSESVIPVFVPGNAKEHIGYFIAIDQEGNPLEIDKDDYHDLMSSALESTSSSFSSGLIRKVNINMNATNFSSKNREHVALVAKFYADMVEKDLIARIRNGVHGSSVKLAKNEEIYRVMLARSLASQYTQLLYIPASYLTYFAFKFDSNGVGVSLLDDTSLINTLRTVVLFTDVISSIKNSIGRTKVNVTLPENDPDPIKTIEMTQNEIVRSRQLSLPMGVTNPSDITDFIQRAAYEFTFDGHPGLPDLKFEFDQVNSSYTKPDSDLQDFLKKSSIMGLGLSPETVENGFSGEFATTVVANNILLSKRITQYQEKFNALVSTHFKNIVQFSEVIYTELKQLVEENIDQIKYKLPDELDVIEDKQMQKKVLVVHSLKAFLNTFELKLPSPPSVTMEGQLQELQTYGQALDEAIDKAYVSSDFMTDTNAGELTNQIDTIKGMIKSYYLRKFMADKGILTELSELTAVNEDGNPQVDLLKSTTEHINALVKSCVIALSKTAPIAKAATDDLQKLGTGEGESGSSDTGSEDTGGEDTGFDFGGEGDLGGSEEAPVEEEPTATEEPEVNPEEEPEPKPEL